VRASGNRDRAMRIIQLNPGIHLRRLQKLLGTSFSTARYHVSNLERDGEIIRSKDRRYDRLYPRGTSDAMQTTFAAMQSGSARRVLEALADSDLAFGDVAERTGLSMSTVSERIKELGEADLVSRFTSPDGHTKYTLHDRERVVVLLTSLQRNMMDIAVENFLDLWDL